MWAQEAALRRVPDSGIVESLDEGRRAEHFRKCVELVERRRGFLPGAGEELDDTMPFVRGDTAAIDGKWRGASKTSRMYYVHIKDRDMMIAQHALCLGDKLVKFAYEALEDKPHSSALGCFNAEGGHTAYKNVRVWCELRELEHVRCDVLRSFWVL